MVWEPQTVTSTLDVISIAGARPNFMKIAPIAQALGTMDGVRHRVVHTGQHYDRNMSGLFFSELGIPEPWRNLEVGSGSHARQTGASPKWRTMAAAVATGKRVKIRVRLMLVGSALGSASTKNAANHEGTLSDRRICKVG